MGEVLAFKKRKLSEKHAGRGLCASGFHKWEVDKQKPFDVKQGRLLSVYRCKRCGATKLEAR